MAAEREPPKYMMNLLSLAHHHSIRFLDTAFKIWQHYTSHLASSSSQIPGCICYYNDSLDRFMTVLNNITVCPANQPGFSRASHVILAVCYPALQQELVILSGVVLILHHLARTYSGLV